MVEMVKDKQRLELTIKALCDELYWGLRCFYAAKVVYITKLRLTPTLFHTFYFSCLDQSALILSRMVIARENSEDDQSINLHYLANLAENKPLAFKFAKPGEIKKLLEKQARLFELHKPLIAILRDQRDQNLAHLDRRHINDTDWRKKQIPLDLSQAEKLYHDLVEVMASHHNLFFDVDYSFGDWQSITDTEVKNLIESQEAYRMKI